MNGEAESCLCETQGRFNPQPQCLYPNKCSRKAQAMTERDPFNVELDELRGSKAALQAEIERLRMLNDELHKLLDGVERRECEYLALIEKHATENEARRVQWEAAKREAEQWVHESGIKLGEAHKEIARLKAERHTTKQMLEDILYKHSQHYGLGRGGLGPKVVKDDPA